MSSSKWLECRCLKSVVQCHQRYDSFLYFLIRVISFVLLSLCLVRSDLLQAMSYFLFKYSGHYRSVSHTFGLWTLNLGDTWNRSDAIPSRPIHKWSTYCRTAKYATTKYQKSCLNWKSTQTCGPNVQGQEINHMSSGLWSKILRHLSVERFQEVFESQHGCTAVVQHKLCWHDLVYFYEVILPKVECCLVWDFGCSNLPFYSIHASIWRAVYVYHCIDTSARKRTGRNQRKATETAQKQNVYVYEWLNIAWIERCSLDYASSRDSLLCC